MGSRPLGLIQTQLTHQGVQFNRPSPNNRPLNKKPHHHQLDEWGLEHREGNRSSRQQVRSPLQLHLPHPPIL